MVLAGYRVVPLPTHPGPHPPRVHPHCRYSVIIRYTGLAARLKVVVGLKSVAQLTLDL